MRSNNSICQRCSAQKGLNALFSFGENWVYPKRLLVKIFLVQRDIFSHETSYQEVTLARQSAFPGSLAENSD